MATLMQPDNPRSSTLLYFLALSFAVHLAMLLLLRGAKLSLGDAEPPPLVVKLAPAPAAPARPAAPAPKPPGAAAKPSEQIVAPSDQENQQPPLGRAFLSDRDNSVEKETIRRGNPDAGAPQPPPQQVASAPKPPPAQAKPAPAPPRAKPAPPPPEAAKAPPRAQKPATARNADRSAPRGETTPERLPGLDQLFAPPSEVLAKADTARQRTDDGGSRRDQDDPRKDLVSAPPPAPGLFGGPRGSFDYLPDVSQGNLTMLNTKADRFAPFVRRVGTRVFQNLLIFQRQNLEPSDILAANEVVTARVTLNSAGKLKNLQVDDHSGSLAVDQTLIDALRQAAFDDNPPPSAANEKGEYEFVFQAQLIAGVGPGARGPELRSVESRLRIGLL